MHTEAIALNTALSGASGQIVLFAIAIKFAFCRLSFGSIADASLDLGPRVGPEIRSGRPTETLRYGPSGSMGRVARPLAESHEPA